ncbi:MAG: hypothetical protein PHS99_08165, partial [Candidatus Marinimicrobia bacterium]|nr:hypothetical protein [Candidatus Neomarinimicrobiota bacterium]
NAVRRWNSAQSAALESFERLAERGTGIHHEVRYLNRFSYDKLVMIYQKDFAFDRPPGIK